MITTIIPTFNVPHALDLCLRSAIEGQRNKNEILVICNGNYEKNKTVLEKHKQHINLIRLEDNIGTVKANNLGAFRAHFNKLLFVNDDNVFPKDWDLKLEGLPKKNTVVSPNQIEPYNSIFRQFVIEDLGRNPETFNLDFFWEREQEISKQNLEPTGSTFPILINKIDFLKVGGFDEMYPSPSGFVSDWDFFMKCEMNGMDMIRSYNCHFYHFVSVSSKSAEDAEKSRQYEKNCHEHFRLKWGTYAEHNPDNNSKMLSALIEKPN